jgi:hypothetical protein
MTVGLALPENFKQLSFVVRSVQGTYCGSTISTVVFWVVTHHSLVGGYCTPRLNGIATQRTQSPVNLYHHESLKFYVELNTYRHIFMRISSINNTG